MAQTWPLTLQNKLSEANFSYEIADTALRSDMEIGPQKVRRRFTKGINQLTGSIYLTALEYSDFYNFYNTTLGSGTISFEFNHPITGVNTEWRFKGPARVSSIGGGNFVVDFSWEDLGDV